MAADIATIYFAYVRNSIGERECHIIWLAPNHL